MTRPDDDNPVTAAVKLSDLVEWYRCSLAYKAPELWLDVIARLFDELELFGVEYDRLRAAAPGVQLGRLSIALHQIQRVVDAYLDDSARAAQADVAEGWPELATALDEMSSWYETWAVEDDPELLADLSAAEGES